MHYPAPTTTDREFAELSATASHDPLHIEYCWLNAERRDAPVAVFLYEGLGSIAMWKDWPQTLCDRLGLRGLVYSRPGYGRSTPRAHGTQWPVDFMSAQAHEVLPALLDALGMDAHERRRLWLIGHSDGASIALLYASAFPDALAGAVAIAPHAFVEDISVESITQAKIAYETTDFVGQLPQDTAVQKAYAARCRWLTTLSICRACAYPRSPPERWATSRAGSAPTDSSSGGSASSARVRRRGSSPPHLNESPSWRVTGRRTACRRCRAAPTTHAVGHPVQGKEPLHVALSCA